MGGYCYAHDIEYLVEHGDEVCPLCLAELNENLKDRDAADNYMDN